MFFIRDLKSRNGTYVNDVRIDSRRRLREGCQIRIGATVDLQAGGIQGSPNHFCE